jgi:hypothetical protein
VHERSSSAVVNGDRPLTHSTEEIKVERPEIKDLVLAQLTSEYCNIIKCFHKSSHTPIGRTNTTLDIMSETIVAPASSPPLLQTTYRKKEVNVQGTADDGMNLEE